MSYDAPLDLTIAKLYMLGWKKAPAYALRYNHAALDIQIDFMPTTAYKEGYKAYAYGKTTNYANMSFTELNRLLEVWHDPRRNEAT